ncbi:MAG: 23S rRNA (pseudouridine(1915)-N(3))-methyltransferase RlmH [Prevotella sp.]|nr:23S rRNA (pseudouridine(1915)-N(3))-methyltransferase RlmH [Prevotella sp.]
MKTQLILVGKTTNKHLATVIDDYVGRIGHYMPFSVVVVPELKNTKALSEEQQKEREGELILQKIKPTDTLVLLDERGSELSSVAFSQWLQRKQSSARSLVFVIGGPYGFSKAVYNRADEQLSLSRMTFSHQLIRVVFAEQLYRACTIIKGEPYHHE